MWVFCCGMQRSGSTLQYNIIKELVEHHAHGIAVGIDNGEKLPPVSEEYLGPDAYVALKIHEYRPEFEHLLSDGEAFKAVYIYRDVRDVVVSWMNMRQQSFEEMDGITFVRTCLSNYEHWTNLPDVLISRYEDVMRQPLINEVQRIANYLNIEISPQQAQSIAQKYDLENQKKYLKDFDFDNRGVSFHWTTYDPETLMHKRHVFSSISGQWRDRLTQDQVRLIEKEAFDWLQGHHYIVNLQTRVYLIGKRIRYWLNHLFSK